MDDARWIVGKKKKKKKKEYIKTQRGYIGQPWFNLDFGNFLGKVFCSGNFVWIDDNLFEEKLKDTYMIFEICWS